MPHLLRSERAAAMVLSRLRLMRSSWLPTAAGVMAFFPVPVAMAIQLTRTYMQGEPYVDSVLLMAAVTVAGVGLLGRQLSWRSLSCWLAFDSLVGVLIAFGAPIAAGIVVECAMVMVGWRLGREACLATQAFQERVSERSGEVRPR